jgi:hypothetical protein
VAGLLRSHADILRSLHALGVGVGDPAEAGGTDAATSGASTSGPLTIGPPLPRERDATSAPAISGVTPTGDALAIAPAGGDGHTLLAFLTSGCSTCRGFWDAFRNPATLGLPKGTRLAVVTKGPELEVPGEVAGLAPPGLPVVMSSQAWTDYEVPGSPFFVLVEGRSGRRVGEGVANHFGQVADLIRRAVVDVGPAPRHARLDGPGRAADNDEALVEAGILPGDPSLYPRSLDDIFQRAGAEFGAPTRAGAAAAVATGDAGRG